MTPAMRVMERGLDAGAWLEKARALAREEMLAELGKRYSRVDLPVTGIMPDKMLAYLSYGADKPHVTAQLTTTPVPDAIVELQNGAERAQAIRMAFFFENDEDAILFKMKYEDKL